MITECPQCAAVVLDASKHRRWHEWTDAAVTEMRTKCLICGSVIMTNMSEQHIALHEARGEWVDPEIGRKQA